MKVVLGIRFSSWNPAFQLEKRIPGQSPEKGGRDEGCLGDPLFELESGIPARKADPLKRGAVMKVQLEKRIPEKAVMKVVLGIRFSSWNPAFQLEKRSRKPSRCHGGIRTQDLYHAQRKVLTTETKDLLAGAFG